MPIIVIRFNISDVGYLANYSFNNIAFAVMLQVDTVNDGFDEADAALSPFCSGAAAMEVKGEVIIVHLITDICFDVGKVVP